MNPVDPLPRKIGQGFNVRVGGQKLRLETSHRAGRGSLFGDGMAADNSPHGRVEAEPVGIVHVVVRQRQIVGDIALSEALSLPQVEDPLHEPSIDICHETLRAWWNRFGPLFAAEIDAKRSASMRTHVQ